MRLSCSTWIVAWWAACSGGGEEAHPAPALVPVHLRVPAPGPTAAPAAVAGSYALRMGDEHTLLWTLQAPFERGRRTLSDPEFERLLSGMVTFRNGHVGETYRIISHGSSSNLGPWRFNWQLSLQRARLAARYAGEVFPESHVIFMASGELDSSHLAPHDDSPEHRRATVEIHRIAPPYREGPRVRR